MERMDKATARAVMQATGIAMDPLLERFGLRIDRVSATYSQEEITVKIRMGLAGIDPVEKQRREFEALAPLYRLSPSHYRASLHHYGVEYLLVGFMRRAHRFPVIAQRVGDGKQLRLPSECLNPLRAATIAEVRS